MAYYRNSFTFFFFVCCIAFRVLVPLAVKYLEPNLRGATWRNIPENGILHSHRQENLKSYIALTG
jgi:hypothetical protein